MTRKKRVRLLGDVIGFLVAGTIFVVPFHLHAGQLLKGAAGGQSAAAVPS